MGQLLGKGSFGKAFIVTDKTDSTKYVMKEIDISKMPKQEKDSALQEAQVNSYRRLATAHPAVAALSLRAYVFCNPSPLFALTLASENTIPRIFCSIDAVTVTIAIATDAALHCSTLHWPVPAA
jgi:hypothetical protein